MFCFLKFCQTERSRGYYKQNNLSCITRNYIGAKLHPFSGKNTVKRLNAFESSIMFLSFLNGTIPAESSSYAPTFVTSVVS